VQKKNNQEAWQWSLNIANVVNSVHAAFFLHFLLDWTTLLGGRDFLIRNLYKYSYWLVFLSSIAIVHFLVFFFFFIVLLCFYFFNPRQFMLLSCVCRLTINGDDDDDDRLKINSVLPLVESPWVGCDRRWESWACSVVLSTPATPVSSTDREC